MFGTFFYDYTKHTHRHNNELKSIQSYECKWPMAVFCIWKKKSWQY